MNVSLSTIRRTLLGVQLVLIFPAALFMASLLMRDSQEPAHTAQRIVLWYSGRLWTLWVLLIGLPLIVLVAGTAALLWSWQEDAELQQTARRLVTAIHAQLVTLLITVVTLTAGCVLAVVVVHMLAN